MTENLYETLAGSIPVLGLPGGNKMIGNAQDLGLTQVHTRWLIDAQAKVDLMAELQAPEVLTELRDGIAHDTELREALEDKVDVIAHWGDAAAAGAALATQVIADALFSDWRRSDWVRKTRALTVAEIVGAPYACANSYGRRGREYDKLYDLGLDVLSSEKKQDAWHKYAEALDSSKVVPSKKFIALCLRLTLLVTEELWLAKDI